MTVLEIAAVVTSFLAIWLTARRNMLCWPLNLVACGLYFKLFLDVRLYADMMLQAAFAVAILYGWVAWARGRHDTGAVVVMPLGRSRLVAGIAAGAIGALAIGWFTSHHTDAALPWMDATLSSFSLVAQYWTARRHRESWLVWIAVDIAYVGMFVVKGLMLTAGLYAVMIGLAMIGYRGWRQARHLSPDGVNPDGRDL
ncbi:nicotinamide riboside transporter PnuC [Sphingomonas prati]|uniref:Nicotinamide riboside transporter PnuC n=1 Tax=Sphingomonas prati TaxID=1843237 RepID=A0A7W9BVH3_9SPHN|nr:nicotinamide riboside transporter PnuC [Sphingomonas prati]MBB5730796.1 nicotinamide mononucleotide transporter [Sphingomonas prati]GGE96801.1 aminotransferase [Sphingomonas prati]